MEVSALARVREQQSAVSLPSALPSFSFEEGPLIGRGAFGLVNLAIVTAVGDDENTPHTPKAAFSVSLHCTATRASYSRTNHTALSITRALR